MNAINMLHDLKKDLEETFESFRFENQETRISFYLQNEPRIIGESEEIELEPMQVIKLINGSKNEESNKANVIIVIQCKNEEENQQGWIDVQNQIDRIIMRFSRNPIFAGKYEVNKISWALAEDNPYPIYIGGVELEIELPNIEKEGIEFG